MAFLKKHRKLLIALLILLITAAIALGVAISDSTVHSGTDTIFNEQAADSGVKLELITGEEVSGDDFSEVVSEALSEKLPESNESQDGDAN